MVGEIFHHLTISTPHPFQYNGSSMLNGELKSFSISCFVSFSLSIALSVLCQFYSYVLAVCRRPFAYVYSHIEHSTFYAAHQFALREWRTLKVQTAHYSIR